MEANNVSSVYIEIGAECVLQIFNTDGFDITNIAVCIGTNIHSAIIGIHGEDHAFRTIRVYNRNCICGRNVVHIGVIREIAVRLNKPGIQNQIVIQKALYIALRFGVRRFNPYTSRQIDVIVVEDVIGEGDILEIFRGQKPDVPFCGIGAN